MLKNYLKIAYRNVWKHKTYSAINIIGFAIGLASCLLIVLYVNNELSFERMHVNRHRIYRVPVNLAHGDSQIPFAASTPPLAPALVEEFPEVESAVRIRLLDGFNLLRDDVPLKKVDVAFTEPCFFTIFSFSLLQGNAATALSAPYSVILSEKMARTYWSGEHPIGQTLTDADGHVFTITGVMQEPSSNTQLDFDFLASYSSLDAMGLYDDQWGQFGVDYVYFMSKAPLDVPAFEAKLPALVEKKTNSAMAYLINLEVQPFTDIYFHSDMNSELKPQGDIDQVYLFAVIALLIMLIACFNFMNLSTARSIHRAKEVGVRKVFGSSRQQLMRQFLGESVAITLLSVVLGLIFFALLYPQLSNFIGRELGVNYLANPLTIVLIVVLAIAVGLLAGIYPAWFLSRFRPISALHAQSGKAKTVLRKIMVITQFTIAVALITITLVVFKQLNFVRTTDLGFDKEHKLIIPLPEQSSAQDARVFKEQLVQIPGAVQASACFGPAGSGSALVLNTVIDDGDEDTPPQEMMLNAIACDSDYIPLFDLHLKEGRNFDNTITSDKTNAVILNEAAVKKFQLDDPLNAELPINGQDQAPSKVIGVLKDFHFRSLRQKITPLMLYQNDRFIQSVVLEYSPDAELAGVISGIQSVWDSQFGSQDFQYHFVDEEYNKLYQAEEKMGKLFIFFSLLIIFVACLGIFGLASFISEQRTKEIGVRKVLGSSVMQIVTLLTTDFVKWVLVANMVAVPIAWYAVNTWLKNFAYRTTVSAWVFVVAGCITMMIALLTIVSQTIHAAQMNPVKTLKYE